MYVTLLALPIIIIMCMHFTVGLVVSARKLLDRIFFTCDRAIYANRTIVDEHESM